MAASCGESKIMTPFMPSLLHFASVKIAVPLFKKFGAETLEEAFSEIQHGNLTTSEANTAEALRASRAKEILLDIPAHLRRGIMEAVHGTHSATEDWKWCHSFLFHLKGEEYNIHWRSEGSIDAAKTAHNLVRNTKLDSRNRFEIASFYCLEESVKALWAEMVKSGETEDFGMGRSGIEYFWVRRMREQTQIPWTESLIQFLDSRLPNLSHILSFPPSLVPRLRVFFPLLVPEWRLNISYHRRSVALDGFRFCLYSLTEKEEKKVVMKNCFAFRLLSLHLRWPLQTLFLETAEKMWNYIDDSCFRALLASILNFNQKLKDFDYSELFERFWNVSPLHLRENTREDPFLRERIDSYFDDKRRKRKYVEEEKSL